MAIAGLIPSILSTSGLSITPKNCLAYADKLSTYLRCPSAYKVSKANDDFPDPDKPVITTNLFFGISKLIFFKLWTRAPRIEMTSFFILVGYYITYYGVFQFSVLLS